MWSEARLALKNNTVGKNNETINSGNRLESITTCINNNNKTNKIRKTT